MRLSGSSSSVHALVAVAVSVLALVASTAPASAYTEAPEGYSSYQPEDGCKKKPRPGTKRLAAWINSSFAGAAVASMRRCDKSTSEHQDGRAIDWMMDATKKKDRRQVKRFLTQIFATDVDEHRHALARRMGIMYVIWDDGMYSAYRSSGADHFERRTYGCRCGSKTARHRDHVHISLSMKGGRARTSWYTESP
jgi:hypothetical protein